MVGLVLEVPLDALDVASARWTTRPVLHDLLPVARRPARHRGHFSIPSVDQEARPITGIKAVEDAAIRFVMKFEREAGREPRDTRHAGAAADIESGERVIEVKAFSKYVRSAGFVPLEVRQVEEAHRNPHFYLYLVENVGQGDPAKFELRIIGGEILQRLLANAKERRYYEMSIRVPDYETLPRNGG